MTVQDRDATAPRTAVDWVEMEGAITAAAQAVLADPHVNTELARHEGRRFLTRFLHVASTFEMEADPAYPHLVRTFHAPGGNWFLPCPDGGLPGPTRCHREHSRRCCCHPIRASELVRDAYLGKAAVA